jgi:hypothetical protein
LSIDLYHGNFIWKGIFTIKLIDIDVLRSKIWHVCKSSQEMKKRDETFNLTTFDASKMLLYVVGFVTIVCAFYIHLDLIGTYDINQLSIIKFSHLANSILKIVYGFLHGSCHKYMTNIIVNIIINIIMDEVHP